MKYDRARPWQYSIEQLVADLPAWRRDLILERFNALHATSTHHAGAAAYWHRQCVDALMVERDRTKYIGQLEQLVKR